MQGTLPFVDLERTSPTYAPPAHRGEAALGLSTSTNLYALNQYHDSYTMEYRAGGEAVRIVPPPEITKEAARFRRFSGTGNTRGDRKKISGFTSKSRLALRRRFDCLLQSQQKCLFVTLTYRENMLNGEQAHKDLNALGAAFRRRYGSGVGWLWKMEQQKRGSIHFHLLLFGLLKVKRMKRDLWDELVAWLAQTWARIVAHGGEIDPEQVKAGTGIEMAEKGRAARAYLEKYIAKVLTIDEDLPELENPGRYWGERYMKQFHAPLVAVQITREQAKQLARILDKYREARIREQWALRGINEKNCTYIKLAKKNGLRVRTWTPKDSLTASQNGAKMPPSGKGNVVIPVQDTWMLRWARKRKKHVQEQRSYWQLALGDSAPRLIDYIYKQGYSTNEKTAN